MVAELLEHVPDLYWPTSVSTYGRMRHDPVLTSVLAAYVNPLTRARWSIYPRGASSDMVTICADSLGLPVLGRGDQGPGPMRRRGVQWRDHVRIASSTMLTFGHAPFEYWYDVSSGKALLAGLGERLPATISGIDVTPAGDLQSASQIPGMTGAAGGAMGAVIPADRLLWYVRDREGAAWQGQSLLRHAFGPWLLKQEGMRVQSTSLRRFGAGTPVMEPLPGYTPTAAQIQAAQRVAESVRVGDSGGATTPGFRLVIKGIEGTVPDSLPFLAFLDQQMARGALTSVLDLGNTGNGSRALGSVFADVMTMALESTAEQLAETASQLCVRLTDFNEGDSANAPAVSVDMSSTRKAIAEAIGSLVQSGGLVMDGSLQAWVRDALDLPEPDPVKAAPVVVPVSAPTPPTKAEPADGPVTEPTPVTAARGRPIAAAADPRALTEREQALGLDPAAVDLAHDAALAAVLAAWPQVSVGQRDQLVEQITAAVDGGDLPGLASLTVDTTDAAEVLAVAMSEAADAGAATAVAEAAYQGAVIAAPVIAEARLVAMASAVAAVMGQATAAAAGREALRLVGSTRTPSGADVAAGVRVHLEEMTGTWPQDQLGGAISDAVGGGRAAVFAAGVDSGYEPTFYASEVLDRNTCTRCLAFDGHQFEDLDEAEAAYPSGGYTGCRGGLRCRGIIVAEWAGVPAVEVTEKRIEYA